MKRLLLLLPTMIGVSLLSFVFIHLAPGGPLESRLRQAFRLDPNVSISRSHIAKLKQHYGYDQTLIERYLGWTSKLLRFDFGQSDLFKQPVSKVLSERIKVSWRYAAISLPICYAIALILSALSITYRSLSAVTIVLAALLFAAPPIVVALCLKYAFTASNDILIVSCYVLVHLSMMLFLFKGSLQAEQRQVYALVARAKGLSLSQVLLHHVLKNAMLPIITSLSYSILAFFSGSLFIETIFSVDGLGLVAYKAFWARDYNLIMGIVFGLSGLFLFCRLLADILYGFVDPRVSVS